MALLLEAQLKAFPQVQITQKVESNVVFAKLPKAIIKRLRESYFFYVWDERTFESRLMTTFDTEPQHIYGFIDKLKELLNSLNL